MDIKRNKRFFSENFSLKLTILAICGILLALICGFVWWYVWYSNFILIGAVVGLAMTVGAVSIRPKLSDITDQLDDARKQLNETAAEKLKYPSDFEEYNLSLFGFVDGTTVKTLKNGMRLTDRVQFTSLYIKRNHLWVLTECCSLTSEDRSSCEYLLPLAGMKISADPVALTLVVTGSEESLTIPFQAFDYSLEEYITKVERQIKKAV